MASDLEDPKVRAMLEALAERARRIDAMAAKIVERDPRIPFLSAVVMAGDEVGAEEWTERMTSEDKRPEEIVNLVGSYQRLSWAVEHCERSFVLDHLADLWRGSDPDDTDTRFLALWREAFQRNGGTVTDGKSLPNVKRLTVYRGQFLSDPLGIAWTLDGSIAHKFARGAGLRTGSMRGAVLRAVVNRSDVLGYLTGRGESEIVVNPTLLNGLQPIGAYGDVSSDASPRKRPHRGS